MLAHKLPSASVSPHPKRLKDKPLACEARRTPLIASGRRRERASLATNTLKRRTSRNNRLGGAFAKILIVDGLEIIEKPGAGTIQKIHYLTGGDGSLFAMYVIDQNNQGEMYYIQAPDNPQNWNGDGVLEFEIPEYTFSEQEANHGQKTAKAYNDTCNCTANTNVILLSDLMSDEFNAKVGTYRMKTITTRTLNSGYGLDSQKGYYINSNNRTAVGSFHNPNNQRSLHTSPGVLYNPIDFTAVAGHKLVHAYHHILLGYPFNRPFSERVAYQYSYSVYISSGNINSAIGTVITSSFNSYGSFWGYYPTHTSCRFSFSNNNSYENVLFVVGVYSCFNIKSKTAEIFKLLL